jgi:hypothetical protein
MRREAGATADIFGAYDREKDYRSTCGVLAINRIFVEERLWVRESGPSISFDRGHRPTLAPETGPKDCAIVNAGTACSC